MAKVMDKALIYLPVSGDTMYQVGWLNNLKNGEGKYFLRMKDRDEVAGLWKVEKGRIPRRK
jgi:hypothetical protein